MTEVPVNAQILNQPSSLFLNIYRTSPRVVELNAELPVSSQAYRAITRLILETI